MTPTETKFSRISLNQIGIYFHIPFCVKKCSYCDFYSVENGIKKISPFINAIKEDIRITFEWYLKRFNYIPVVKSVYFGGGTPSLLNPEIFEIFLDEISKFFYFKTNAEVSIEINPETATFKYMKEINLVKRLNRLSLGVQTFSEKFLSLLGRQCNLSQIYRAIDLINEFKYRNYNLDIIVGISGESLKDIENDIEKTIKINPNHVSVYLLSLKKKHYLYEKLPSEIFSKKIYNFVRKKLIQSGFNQYEISNFSRPGFESLHNLIYWNGGDFLGFGPSAASRVFINGVFYHRKFRADLDYYLFKRTNNFIKSSFEQTIIEACFLELRKMEGINIASFYQRYKYDLLKSKKLSLLLKNSFLKIKNGTLSLTSKGLVLTDYIALELADVNKRP